MKFYSMKRGINIYVVPKERVRMDDSLMKNSGAPFKGKIFLNQCCLTLEQTAHCGWVLHYLKYSSKVECAFLTGKNHGVSLALYISITWVRFNTLLLNEHSTDSIEISQGYCSPAHFPPCLTYRCILFVEAPII